MRKHGEQGVMRRYTHQDLSTQNLQSCLLHTLLFFTSISLKSSESSVRPLKCSIPEYDLGVCRYPQHLEYLHLCWHGIPVTLCVWSTACQKRNVHTLWNLTQGASWAHPVRQAFHQKSERFHLPKTDPKIICKYFLSNIIAVNIKHCFPSLRPFLLGFLSSVFTVSQARTWKN